jgi:hypothetical protein
VSDSVEVTNIATGQRVTVPRAVAFAARPGWERTDLATVTRATADVEGWRLLMERVDAAFGLPLQCPACGYADDHCDTAGGGLVCGRCSATVRETAPAT